MINELKTKIKACLMTNNHDEAMLLLIRLAEIRMLQHDNVRVKNIMKMLIEMIDNNSRTSKN